MAHDVFISHSTNNRPVANAVCAALEREAIRCWIAPRDVMPGRSYSGEITRAIQQSRAFLLIFSEQSNNSEQVLREVQLAANSRLHIVQFRIDAVVPSDDLEYYLSGPHWLDAVTPPLENHLAQLQISVKALLALPRAGETEKAATPKRPRPGGGAESPEARPASPVLATAPLSSRGDAFPKYLEVGGAGGGCPGRARRYRLVPDIRSGEIQASSNDGGAFRQPHSGCAAASICSAKSEFGVRSR